MRLVEFAGLSFSMDNPGGGWLAAEQEDCARAGKNQHGAPKRFGATTGYFSRKVLLPVSLISRLNGRMGEQYNTREDDLAWLVDYMGKNNHLPVENGKQYAPFITVDMNGTPWVSEGNHRIKAAKQLGWKYLPVELKYFSGGEEKDGMLNPVAARGYDTSAISAGFKPDNEFRGKND
jgi:hypothetical protein